MPKVRRIFAAGFVLGAMLLAAMPAGAAERTETVKFAAGKTSAVMSGTIKGDDSVRYVLGARAGQKLSVQMTARNASCYINVLAPGSDTAVHIGSTSGNKFSGPVTATGDQAVQVYLMRNAARRNEMCSYKITFGITG
jgi:hypothetical protein